MVLKIAMLLAGVSTIAVMPAHAQEVARDAQAAETLSTEAAQEIIVTGSRVVRNGNASATPVTVVSADKLQDLRPSTIADQLNTVPIFASSRQQTSFGQATGNTGGGNGTANLLNIRGVGTNRNLILLDGRRVPPTTGFNSVDADAIPQMLIQRVDVVTGGVSAVYGSDAVSGVVNFIVDRNLQGFKAHASAGISRYGDGATYNIGIAGGTRFAEDRGHFEASYEFRDDKGIPYKSDRPWFKRPVVAGSGTQASPFVLVENGRLPNLPFEGRINACGTGCSLAGQYFADDGVLRPFPTGTLVTTPDLDPATAATVNTFNNLAVGGAGGYYDSSLKSPLRSHQFFARLDYELTDDIHAFAYGSANIKRNSASIMSLQLQNVVLSRSNPFLAPAYQAAITQPTFTFSRIINQTDTRITYEPRSYQYIGVAGLEGKTAGIDWTLAYNHGDATLKTSTVKNINNQKLAASLDAVRNTAGQIVCGINNDAIASNDDAACVPLNPFGPSATSQAALDYVLGTTHYRVHTLMDDLVLETAGSPFSTGAGDVRVALTGEWRQLRVSAFSDGTPNQTPNCTGGSTGTTLRNCSATNTLWAQTFSSSPQVKQSVWEAAGEVQVPLLKDAPFAKSFDLNGAARLTDYYDTVGKYWTWKGGFSWEVNDDLRFRGTISRDIRAPTLNDLFAPVQRTVSSANTDLLTNTSPTVPNDQLSNPNLGAEIGHTKTMGLVFKPSFLPGFSAAIDYFELKITDAIFSIVGSQAPFQNACYDSGGTSIYCQFQERPGGFARTAGNMQASNALTRFLAYPVNIGKITTKGVDVELNYSSELFGRALTLRNLMSWQPHLRYVQPGVPVQDSAGVAHGFDGRLAAAKWRVNAVVSYDLTENVHIDIQERWRGKLKYSADPTAVFYGQDGIGSQATTAVNLAVKVPTNAPGNYYEFFVNVQNLFDADPQVSNATNTAGAPGNNHGFASTDDPVGRYFTVGVRARF